MGKTEDNVRAAFAGESQANRRYLFFAEKADTEGYPQIAKLFRAVADAETIHAKNHLKVLDEIGSTSDNLSSAINGESYEYTTMYPEFIKQAEKDDNQTAKRSFDLANQVEQIHHKLFQTMLSKVNAKDAIDAQPVYVCQVCGYTVEGEAPDRCPVCGAPVKMFKEVE